MRETPTCPKHPGVKLVMFCPACRGKRGGQVMSTAKTRAIKQNLRKAWKAKKEG